MALTTPIGIPVPAFDATQPQIFKFTVSGGDQVVGNILTIIDNTTGTQVGSWQTPSLVYQQRLPASTLVNDGYYKFYFQTINTHGDISNPSIEISFRTYTQPTLAFTNIPSTKIIQSATFTFNCRYTQIEGEPISNIVFHLYDANKNEIDTQVVYNSDPTETDFTYTHDGFIDNEKYYIQAIGTTLHDTVIQTNNSEDPDGYHEFDIDYEYEGTYFKIQATNFANGGYVQVLNNVNEVDGIMLNRNLESFTPTEKDFYGSVYVDLTNNLLNYNAGYQIITNGFVMQEWWFPRLFDGVVQFMNDDNTHIMNVSFNRAIDSNDDPFDYLTLTARNQDGEYLNIYSNHISVVNNFTQLITYVKITDSDAEIIFQKANVYYSAEWNGESNVPLSTYPTMLWVGETASNEHNVMDMDNFSSNVEFDAVTDIFWEDESYATPIVLPTIQENVPSDYFYNTYLYNSLVNGWWVSKDTSLSIQSFMPEWDNYTVMLADKYNEHNINAGNVEWLLSNVNKLKIKRKLADINSRYVTIFEKPVNQASDLGFNYRDYFTPSGKKFIYAMVPCVDENEQTYFTTEVETYFNGLFVSDTTQTLKLYSEYGITSSNTNILLGQQQPYNLRYPVTIKNPNVLYRTIGLKGAVLGLNYANDEDNCVESTYQLNDETRLKTVEEKLRWDAFLCNGRTKIIKDWNGNIIMAQVTTPPSYTYDETSGNSKPVMSFGVTEQGQYDNQSDLYNHGLSNAKL